MLDFSTDDLRPQDRFPHWCEVRGKTLFGVTIELPRERRGDFHGRFRARDAGGGAVVVAMRGSSYLVKRTEADIARVAADSLYIGRQVRGPGRLDVGRRRVQQVDNGTMTISYSDLPYTGTPDRTDGFDYLSLKIPLEREMLLGAQARDLVAAIARPDAPYVGPLVAMFDAITAAPAAVPSAEIAHLARLAMLARGRIAVGLPESRAAIRAGILQAARAIVRRNFGVMDLSPEQVARELGISVRQLHVIFEPTGLSFARTLLAIRIEAARQLLQAHPKRAISDVAYACGFDSLATFYRAFRKAHGMTPSDMRAVVPAGCDLLATTAAVP